MTTHLVRIATYRDVADVERCVTRAYERYVEAIGREPAPMLADYDTLVARGVVHVIDDDYGLAGVIVMWSESDHFYIDNIAVDPGRQGHGIGSRLLAHAEHVATRAGHREVRLFTNEAMIDNLAFYPRRGYVESHRQVEGGYHRVYFTRDISNSSPQPWS